MLYHMFEILALFSQFNVISMYEYPDDDDFLLTMMSKNIDELRHSFTDVSIFLNLFVGCHIYMSLTYILFWNWQILMCFTNKSMHDT